MIGYIYKVTNTVNDKVYIGQTITTVTRRWRRHIRDSYNKNAADYDCKFHRAIRKYTAEKFIVEEEINVNADTKEELIDLLNDLEIMYVKRYDSFRYGYNSTIGGSALSAQKTGALNPQSIKILQYTSKAVFVKEWDAIADAARAYNCSDTTIIDCCKGKVKTVKGFIWRYKDDPQKLPVKEVEVGKQKIILQYDLDGNFIKEWDSMADIRRELNLHVGHIPDVCKGRRSQAFGFVWKYKYPND